MRQLSCVVLLLLSLLVLGCGQTSRDSGENHSPDIETVDFVPEPSEVLGIDDPSDDVGIDDSGKSEPTPANGSSRRKVVIETEWYYDEVILDPPRRLSPGPRPIARRDTPINAAISQFSTMISGDFQAWRSGWDEDSQKALGLVSTSNESASGDAENWIRNWAIFKDTTTYLVAQATTPDFVIVAFEVRRTTAKGPIGTVGRNRPFDEDGVWRDRLLFVNVEGVWLQSNQFAGQPTWQLWRSGMQRMTLVGEYNADRERRQRLQQQNKK